MADGPKRSLTEVEESAEEERPSTKRRKPRNGVTQLAEIRPGTVYQLVAQYGSAEDQIFVMQLALEGKIFKGIGPSKTKAKAMAAEFALVHLGVIASLTESPPDLSNQPYCWDDFTADIFDSNSHIYFDFNHQATAAETDRDADVCAGEENAEELEGSSESRMIGKNTLTILMDRHPGSSYKLVAAEVNSVRTKFVMDCYVNGQVFRGVGMSKRLAKARAAKQALQKLDSMEFGTGEDGMPFYEGDEKLWLKYKAELEKEAELKLQNEVGDNPAQQLSEYFPDAKFNFPDTFEKPDIADFFVCSISVDGATYEGSGTSKKDAKNDAAASVLNDLERKGILKQKELEMESKRQEREEKKKAKDGTERKPTAYKSAVAKLNDNFQNIEYKFLSETPLRNTRITAFTVAVNIKGRHYIGVGKNKRMAKLDAAEKVLRDLGMWTEQDEQARERVKTEEDDLDMVGESNQGAWNSGQDQHCWGSGWGGQAVSWNSGANQYMGYENNGSWGYGGGYYGGQGVWGQMGVNQGGNFETIQPMMKEIMGCMFENAFGNNPWKADSGIGVNSAPYVGTGGSGSQWNANPGTRLGNKSDGNNSGSAAESAVRPPAANSPLLLKSQSGMKRSSPSADRVAHSKETPDGKPGKNLSKYPNFRSAGYDTGFTQSRTDPATAAQKQFSSQLQSNYGPYGTPINPSVAGTQNAGFQNFRSAKDGVGSGTLTTKTANSQSGLFAKDQRKAPLYNTGTYSAGASGSLQNSTSSGAYSYGSTESLLDRGRGGSAGTRGTGMYSDFGSGSYQGYPVTSRTDGFQSGNYSTSSFTIGGGGNAPTGYNSSCYSSGGSNFQSTESNYNYSGTGGNTAVQATSVPATVYQSNQVNYSTNFQADVGNSAAVTSFSSGSFQENAGGTNYMTDANSGFYGMYGSGAFPHQSQGGFEFGYNSSSGSYNMNSGYELDGCQNTNSGYSYEYSAPSAGTDSYYTNMNRTTW